jgi:5-methylcytosine-specific restriction enzyme subunit McrC
MPATKYKAEKPGGFPDADLYQLLAYCTTLRLPVGHLVYAEGNEARWIAALRGSASG